MLRRLAASQEHFPLALEMASFEQEALREMGQTRPVSKESGKLPQRPDDALDSFEH
jgi:hypothetical protein